MDRFIELGVEVVVVEERGFVLVDIDVTNDEDDAALEAAQLVEYAVSLTHFSLN